MRSLLSLPRVRLSRFLPMIFFLLSISIFTYLTLSARRLPASVIPFADPIPLTTLIIVWDGVKLPSFSSYFFDSVGRQGHALELLLVQRGCSDLTQLTGGHGNIKHVCLSEDKFWGAHRDYLCKRWGGCTRAQSKLMLGDMVTLGRLAMPQAVYPTLRGWVFKKFMDPRTAFWGYCDMDIFIGDMSQNFPYDLAAQDDYDVFIPTEPSEQGGNRLLFMRGHLTFFRNSITTEDRMLRYEYFRSFEAWDEMIRPSMSVGEAEQSHFVVGDPKVNLLAFDGLAPAPLIRSSSLAGVVSLPDSLRPASGTPTFLPPHVIRQLMTPALHLPTRPSFSNDGLVFPMNITQGEAPPGYGLWFPEHLCSWYIAEPQPKESHGVIGGAGRQWWRRYVMKLDNQWTERLEPMREFRGHFKDGGMDGAHQWLYALWQEEKKKSYFRDLPTHISPGDIFVSYFYDGNAVFDAKSGKCLFWLPKRGEDCGYMGCVEPGGTPVHERKTYEHFTSTQSAFAGWYEHSKMVRLGFATGTAGPDPSKPTEM